MNTTSQPVASAIIPRLSIMMFLQFFAWGAWFATLGLAMGNGSLGDFIGGAYETAPIAAIFAPLFLGLIADRLFASEKVFGVLMIIGGIIMCAIPGVAAEASAYSNFVAGLDVDLQSTAPSNGHGKMLVWLILAYMMCYMPTLGLGNTIAFTHIPSQDKFPMIRVWGTIGWIVAGLLIGGTGWDGTFTIFWLGAASSLVLGVYCFFLPSTPPPLKGTPMNLRSLLMVDAFKLLANWNFFVFAICSMLISIPLAYYYGSTSQYLGQIGFKATGATMSLGQMSEIFFMLLIPFFFRKLGVKIMILIGMACWVLRYLLFSYGATDQTTWMILFAVLLHGICYDFFFVTGFMYTDKKAPKEIRGQAQSLLVFLTQGVGMFFGYRIMAQGSLFNFDLGRVAKLVNIDMGQNSTVKIPLDLHIGEFGKTVGHGQELTDAIKAATPKTDIGFFETFGKMFSRDLPEKLDGDLLTTTMGEWHNFWMLPAIMAAVVFVIFAIGFWDRTDTSTVSAPDESA